MSSEIIGRTLAGYRITELIGRGGMGIVYKARHLELEQDRALKIMDTALARNESFMKRFRVEAKALARLKSPNIVTVYDLCETEIGVCLIMEYVSGSTLAEIIRSTGALSRPRVFKIFRQILTALEHAHAAGIIHRDIKPGNVMVTESDEVKVADFGLAKIQQQTSTTVTQFTGGTLFYVSPEQLEGLVPIDHRSDLYSVGMTLYEALTGAVPFDKSATEFRISERIVKGKIPPPSSLKGDIPKTLNDFVMKAIARDPKNRFQSASKMLAELEKIQAAETQSQHLVSRRTRPRVVLAAFVAVLAAFGGYIILRMIGPEPGPAQSDASTPAVPQAVSPDTTAGAPAVPRDSVPMQATSVGVAESPKKRAVPPVEKPPLGNVQRLTVFVHDKNKNPVPNCGIRLTGLNRKEYQKRTDASGKGIVSYDVAMAGLNPLVEISFTLTDGRSLSPSRKRVLINPARVKLDIDINTFFPDWDKNIEGWMERARKLILEEEWREARDTLRQVLDRRPGQGSAEAHVLMGQAWFEDNSKYYRQASEALVRASALRKEISGTTNIPLRERMQYYLIVAGFEEFDRLDSDSPMRKDLKKVLLDRCAQYDQFSKGDASRRLNFKEYSRHARKVSDIQRKLAE